MPFKFIYSILIAVVLIPSCTYKEDPLAKPAYIEPAKYLPLLDSVRDRHMGFHVYDSLSGNLIGKESWQYLYSFHMDGIPAFAYGVYRSYHYDSSGGVFSISRPDKAYADIIEFNRQARLLFLEGRKEKYHPQDFFVSTFRSEGPNGRKKVVTRMYHGVKEVPYKSSTVYAHRAGRDSTAIHGSTPPYRTKSEDYYFSSDEGLVYMSEKHVFEKSGGDSLLYWVVKKRY